MADSKELTTLDAVNAAQSLVEKFTAIVTAEQRRMLEREKEVKEKQDAWEKLASRFSHSQLSDPVVFNVGGTKFATSLDTLKKLPDTYFANLVSGRWELKLSADGSIFVDRNSSTFGYLLDYLRDPASFAKVVEHLTPMERTQLDSTGLRVLPDAAADENHASNQKGGKGTPSSLLRRSATGTKTETNEESSFLSPRAPPLSNVCLLVFANAVSRSMTARPSRCEVCRKSGVFPLLPLLAFPCIQFRRKLTRIIFLCS